MDTGSGLGRLEQTRLRRVGCASQPTTFALAAPGWLNERSFPRTTA
jgi:hypothetical protein